MYWDCITPIVVGTRICFHCLLAAPWPSCFFPVGSSISVSVSVNLTQQIGTHFMGFLRSFHYINFRWPFNFMTESIWHVFSRYFFIVFIWAVHCCTRGKEMVFLAKRSKIAVKLKMNAKQFHQVKAPANLLYVILLLVYVGYYLKFIEWLSEGLFFFFLFVSINRFSFVCSCTIYSFQVGFNSYCPLARDTNLHNTPPLNISTPWTASSSRLQCVQ